ncbi:hypothetical protein GUJ93_ZPchr0012g21520 [Zizania palustris]|uniref:Uncharacterized protein n=1 Tax=Zizania palustris TaxID=103762 RepID=A0A8J6BVF9_ZIZPA|nr:hypothetical protein GUJ93_ZPchr0012g21520 [Zizania palustris]
MCAATWGVRGVYRIATRRSCGQHSMPTGFGSGGVATGHTLGPSMRGVGDATNRWQDVRPMTTSRAGDRMQLPVRRGRVLRAATSRVLCGITPDNMMWSVSSECYWQLSSVWDLLQAVVACGC